MNLQQLRQHVGNLVQINAPLYWFDDGGRRDTSLIERICILLDADHKSMRPGNIRISGTSFGSNAEIEILVCLLIDCVPHWFYVNERTLRIVK